ncbi:hypothetical protein RvY_05661 [Ramazzottius varieornatus]|uniref:Uncharacterized protein n=1 Tax=Ramazzottius varieornatus TaxID=947166 RepID=A0A1D1UVS9_RAMVA|nr:hypothetical protein RvY_05661 [Ramazzottius varieornatus]
MWMKDGRFRGLPDQHWVSSSLKPSGMLTGTGSPKSFSLPTPQMIEVESKPGMTPKAQTSIFSVHGSLRMTSGAIQATVPAKDICILFWSSAQGRMVPKSDILTRCVIPEAI